MQDGDIIQAGRYEDILGGTDFLKLVGAHQQALNAIDVAQISARRIVPQTGIIGSRLYDALESESNELYQKEDAHNPAPRTDGNRFEQIVKEEERESGKAKMQVYFAFITSLTSAHSQFELLV